MYPSFLKVTDRLTQKPVLLNWNFIVSILDAKDEHGGSEISLRDEHVPVICSETVDQLNQIYLNEARSYETVMRRAA